MPYKQSWLDVEQALGGRVVLHGSIEELRGMWDQMTEILRPQLPKPSENVETKDGEVDGVKYRVYNPKGQSGPLPVGLWTHGGGYISGDLDSEDLLCRLICEHASSVIVSIDYRLAPESKWPNQLEDCLKVYRWAHQNAASIGGDPNKFYLGGGSAGGGLAFQTANRIVQDAQLKNTLKGIVALVPITAHWDSIPEEYRSTYKAYTDNEKNVPFIDKESMIAVWNFTGMDPKDHDAFVILATENHKNFPPTYFASCEYDPLRDDSFVMEKALKKAGVPTKHDHYEGFGHYFWVFPSVPEGQQFVGNVLAGVEWVKSQM